MTPGLLYFHGFNTAPEPPSDKICTLRALAETAGWAFHAPALHYHRLEAGQPQTVLSRAGFDALQGWFETHDPLVVGGSSLGGWLARRWPSGDAVAGRLLINPVCGPLSQLTAQGGEQWVNYVSGETYTLPWDFRQRLEATERVWPGSPVDHTLVLLDLADEVLDSAATQARIQSQAEVLAFPGGSHRFEHLNEAAPRLRQWLGELASQQ